MYRRTPTGEYLVGVCTNTLCAIMGGDAILEALRGPPRHPRRPDHRRRQGHARARRVQRRLRLRAGRDGQLGVLRQPNPSSARDLVDAAARGRVRDAHPRRAAVHVPRDRAHPGGLPRRPPRRQRPGTGRPRWPGCGSRTSSAWTPPPTATDVDGSDGRRHPAEAVEIAKDDRRADRATSRRTVTPKPTRAERIHATEWHLHR